MTTSRLEALSDGVIAIVITLMVLGLRVPEASALKALRPVLPQLAIYLVSFVYLAIYWTNHHALFQRAVEADSMLVWANFGLLWVLSLLPPATEWAGHHPDAAWPAAVHGGVLLAGGMAYLGLERSVIRRPGLDRSAALAARSVSKTAISLSGYVVGTGLAFVRPWLAEIIYFASATPWLVARAR